jgi:predicted RNase H-like nuclease (RuvC/YqgF family)
VSNAAARSESPTVPEWDRLELTVRRLMEDHEAWRRRALAAEKRIRELETALRDVSEGTLDPVAVSDRASVLERENRQLTRRMRQAHETVERILNRLQFAEEDR